MLNTNKLILAVAIATAITGCGGSSKKHHASASSGLAVDGYLSGSAAVCDTNDDGIADSTEPVTLTGADGKFTFSPSCTHNVIISGGTNLVKTGVEYPFVGQLKAPAGSKVATPLTTLMAESGLTSDELAAMLGLPAGTDITSIDPTTDDALNRATLAVAQIIQSLAATFGATPGDFSIYANIAKTLALELKTQLTANPGFSFMSGGSIDLTTIQNAMATVNSSLPAADQLSTAALNTVSSALQTAAANYLDTTKTPEDIAEAQQDPDAAPIGGITTAALHYVYLKNDTFKLNGTSVAYTDKDFVNPSTGFATTSLKTVGFVFNNHDYATFEPNPKTVSMALSLEGEQGSNSVEMILTEVNIVQVDGVITSVTVPTSSKVYAHFINSSGAEGNLILSNLDEDTVSVISATNEVRLNTDGIFDRLDAADKSGNLNFLPLTGKYTTGLVVSNLNFRKTDGSALKTITASVPNAKDASGKSVPGITGFGVSGTINIAAAAQP